MTTNDIRRRIATIAVMYATPDAVDKDTAYAVELFSLADYRHLDIRELRE